MPGRLNYSSEDAAGNAPLPGFWQDYSADFESPATPGWMGAPEQVKFRDQVLMAHIARSRARLGEPKPDALKGSLGPVEGTQQGPNGLIWMRKDAAEWAGRLLKAANESLAKARQQADADALRTISITANSGNRLRAEQLKLWLRYFTRNKPPGYYDQTAQARQSLSSGPHSAEAISYLLDKFRLGNRIAAPGYSNHQGGIAIDFWQNRARGFEIPNQTDKGYPNGGGPNWKRWRATWFFKWLTMNAANFHFYPYSVEPWHWEYGPGGPPRESETGRRPIGTKRHVAAARRVPAGTVAEYDSSELPLRIALYCPKEAASQGSIDVVLYAHGLNGGQCGTPAKSPKDFINNPPFGLGTIIDDSLSGVALIVPFMDWEHLTDHRMGFGAKDRRGNPRWHKLAIPDNFNRVLAESLGRIGQLQGGGPPALRRLIIAGHSRAYDFLDPLANAHSDPEMSRGALAKLSEVWAFDTTYSCPVTDWKNWLRSKPGLKLKMFYRPGSPTANCAESFASVATLVKAPEAHCDVPARRLPALLAALATGAVAKESSPPEVQAEQEDVNPVVARVCAISNKIAAQTRNALHSIAGRADASWRSDAIRSRAAGQLNRISGELVPRLPGFNRREVDLLAGCLGRVEHAIGRETVPMKRFRAAARQRLQTS